MLNWIYRWDSNLRSLSLEGHTSLFTGLRPIPAPPTHIHLVKLCLLLGLKFMKHSNEAHSQLDKGFIQDFIANWLS